MNSTEKMMNGLLPMLTIFIASIATFSLFKFFEKRGPFAIFKTGLVMTVVLALLFFIGQAMG